MGRKGKIREDIVALSEDNSPNIIKGIWSGTEAERVALPVKNNDTIYFAE